MYKKKIISIKSYVLRCGKNITLLHKYIIKKKFNKFKLNINKYINFKQLFGFKKIVIDIGFGMGDSLINQAINNPNIIYIGIEVYLPGIIRIINILNKNNIKNVKIIIGDAVLILKKFFNNSIDNIQIFFPDPWPKIKHNKRRIIFLSGFIINIIRCLKKEGILHIVTDNKNYALKIINFLENTKLYYIKKKNISRPITKYEQISKKLGNKIWEMIFYKYIY
ncbi:tRNA (guanine-N(7)-)-methyltransferase [Candidatus Johnevansia muelleri]|uniref:tRNA (guanine-N(7)-)-methyltransferase n=1 Tax=Candidatus Johnevansia muelleri TaxID=1495769 RepID=A0A078KET0_9GAMM|nr:tRNA (guanine-N(7)-)-methyltransferase [Candidatus Evansia muelleri]